MLHTFETRISPTEDVAELLVSNAAHWSWGLRCAWSMLNRQQMREREIYAASTRKGFTSEQAGSLLIAVKMRYAALAELKKYELSQVKLGIRIP